MKLFKQFFTKKRSPQDELANLESTSQLMGEEQYWDIVAASLQNSDGLESQEKYLIKALESLPPQEIIGFRVRTDALLFDSYTSNLWGACFVLNGGASDDMFEYFRLWLISRGREVYYAALNDPDSIVDISDEGEEDFWEFESFWYVALEAFENATGKELYDYLPEDQEKCEGKYPNIEFSWSESDPKTLSAICPRLYEKYKTNFTFAHEQ